MVLLVASAAGANGNGYGALLAFGPDGRALGAFSDDARIADPSGLAVDRSEGLLFLTSGANRVLAIDATGQVVRDTVDGVNLLWQEAIGTIRGRYFILTRQELDAQTAKQWGAVNEILPLDRLLTRAREIAERLVKLPPLTTRYTRIALTQKLRRIIDEGVGYGLALEGISAADVARSMSK